MSVTKRANDAYWARQDRITEELANFRQDLREEGLSEGAIVAISTLLERIIRMEERQ